MAENKQNNDHEENLNNTRSEQLKRSSSSDGTACKAGLVNWDDYITARGDERLFQCTSTTPVIWDNWAATSSASGDDLMDTDGDKASIIGPETRKRKGSDITNNVFERKPKCQRYLSSLTTSQTICEPRDEKIALYNRGIPAQHFHVLSATAGTSKATESDEETQTTKSPLVPASPVIFMEPAPKKPASLEMSYFGPGARMEDGTLRPPPVFCAPGSCQYKEAPQVEKSVEAFKQLERGGNDKTPQAKQEHTPDEDPKKKKNTKGNTDRYLKMF